jgi:hypothetical protein
MRGNLTRRIEKLEQLASVGSGCDLIDALKALNALRKAEKGDKGGLAYLLSLRAPEVVEPVGEWVRAWAQMVESCRQKAHRIAAMGEGP